MLCEYFCVYITVNSKFEKYTGFIPNSNNIFNLTGLSDVGCLKTVDTNNALNIGQQDTYWYRLPEASRYQ
jgi:hypothetical protein